MLRSSPSGCAPDWVERVEEATRRGAPPAPPEISDSEISVLARRSRGTGRRNPGWRACRVRRGSDGSANTRAFELSVYATDARLRGARGGSSGYIDQSGATTTTTTTTPDERFCSGSTTFCASLAASHTRRRRRQQRHRAVCRRLVGADTGTDAPPSSVRAQARRRAVRRRVSPRARASAGRRDARRRTNSTSGGGFM